MTNEKRYELVLKMIRDYDAVTDRNTEKLIEKYPYICAKCKTLPFIGAAAQMLIDARQGMDKQTTSAGSLAALNRVYKSAAAGVRENLHGFFPSGDRWALCDGYRFIRVNSKPESIPMAPESPNPLDLDRAIPQGAREAEPVSLPSAAAIKAAIAELKARYGKEWKYQPYEALPGWWCNPQYLLDMVQALPDGTAYAPKNDKAPLYYESENGDALLLPVRHTAA